MTGDVADTNLFHLTMAQSQPVRIRRYREEAARFRRMAEIETDGKLRRTLMSLARQYDDLAAGFAA
jgi:hypothetical protein